VNNYKKPSKLSTKVDMLTACYLSMGYQRIDMMKEYRRRQCNIGFKINLARWKRPKNFRGDEDDTACGLGAIDETSQ
jgi:hypothetical protein